jgi:hypothetical protein
MEVGISDHGSVSKNFKMDERKSEIGFFGDTDVSGKSLTSFLKVI